jgi:hypothetical protein
LITIAPIAISKLENPINKDLLLRENLALQRTIFANQTTFYPS